MPAMSGSWHCPEIRQAIAREQARELSLLRDEAMDRARRIAALLKDKYRVVSVVAYGSLVEGGFDAHSDIDLMVDGFAGPFWEMYAEAGRVADPFPLSIVRREDASPSLLEHVLRRGVKL
jgi:predicted nucleotidyltransferase